MVTCYLCALPTISHNPYLRRHTVFIVYISRENKNNFNQTAKGKKTKRVHIYISIISQILRLSFSLPQFSHTFSVYDLSVRGCVYKHIIRDVKQENL